VVGTGEMRSVFRILVKKLLDNAKLEEWEASGRIGMY
jgi:hypothetical protein